MNYHKKEVDCLIKFYTPKIRRAKKRPYLKISITSVEENRIFSQLPEGIMLFCSVTLMINNFKTGDYFCISKDKLNEFSLQFVRLCGLYDEVEKWEKKHNINYYKGG